MTQSSDLYLAQILNTLSHKRRVKIFRILFENAGTGTQFATLEARARIPHSSLIHHLRVMQAGGLLTRHSVGARTIYRLSLSSLTAHISDLTRLLGQTKRDGKQDMAA